jgi:hypothetical protein
LLPGWPTGQPRKLLLNANGSCLILIVNDGAF